MEPTHKLFLERIADLESQNTELEVQNNELHILLDLAYETISDRDIDLRSAKGQLSQIKIDRTVAA